MIIRCHCGIEAQLKRSSTKQNYGRYFYSCSKYNTEESGTECNFFCWQEEAQKKSQSGTASALKMKQRETGTIGTSSPASTSRLSSQIEITDYDNNPDAEIKGQRPESEKTLTNIVEVTSITTKNTPDVTASSPQKTKRLIILSDSDNELSTEKTSSQLSSSGFLDNVITYVNEQNKALSREKLLKNEARLQLQKSQYENGQLKRENQELRQRLRSIKRKQELEDEDEDESEEERDLDNNEKQRRRAKKGRLND
ncbi:231_t:CDS:2 [Ambispora gerdemannii]|uniref:231_t:CDS:1 n=1 Tax=Ambispora gerdemannii TaxID=144530 RepID=A0A9N8WC82_9GLOM|nr:231_t:CDS:2 [Ambispora gerdemannii]